MPVTGSAIQTARLKMPDDAPPPLMVSLTVNEPGWRDIPLETDLENFLETMARTAFLSAEIGCLTKAQMIDISLVLSNDEEIQGINAEYRGKKSPTNVLSFPQMTPEEISGDTLNNVNFVPLGDVILSLETILREAKEQNKEPDAHIAHMIVHGVLHLLGYDHENDSDAQTMETLETFILTGLGFEPPYTETDNSKTRDTNEDAYG